MKDFFKMLFASCLGFCIAGILLIIIGVGIIASAGSALSKKEEVVHTKPNSILKLPLNYTIKERGEDNPLGKLTGEETTIVGLDEILNSIRHASQNPDIKGIYLPLNVVTTSFANLGEIRKALLSFKSTGKFIVAYGEMISQRSLYIGSVADEIYLNPQGYLELSGMSNQLIFLKDMLEKIGVEPKIFYAGKFKSATEPLRRTDMSPENEEQTLAYVNDVYTEMITHIAEGRKMESTMVDSICDNLLIRKPQDAITYKMVDGLKYEDEVLQILTEKTGKEKVKDLTMIGLLTYKNQAKDNDKAENFDSKVAVLYAEGDITSGKSDDGIGSEDMVKHIRKLREDSKVKAVVLRISSPGGSALASDIIWRELMLLKKAKPLVVSMGTYAASGGYYMSCMADTIFAEPTTLTGSIGVFAVLPNTTKLLNEKLGVHTDGIATGKYSDLGNPTRAMRPDEEAIMQAEVIRIYDDFKQRVAEGRKTDTAAIELVAQGRVWTGKQAISKGLVDRLGTKQDAIACAARMANLGDAYRIMAYPPKKDPLKQILNELQGNKEDEVKGWLGNYYTYVKQLRSLNQMQGVQARMPFTFQNEW